VNVLHVKKDIQKMEQVPVLFVVITKLNIMMLIVDVCLCQTGVLFMMLQIQNVLHVNLNSRHTQKLMDKPQ
jgi:hypothetical protein